MGKIKALERVVGQTLSKSPQWGKKALIPWGSWNASTPSGPNASYFHGRRTQPTTVLNTGTLLGRRNASSSSDASKLHRTGLYDLHVASGGKMVPFAGYSMPVQYSDLSLVESHKWTRAKASLFDVGHMVQHRISGAGATALLEIITPSSIAAIKPFHSTLSCFLHPMTGGIVDDTVITRLGPELFYLVTNAACREKDLAYLSREIEAQKGGVGDIKWEIMHNWGLVALQGPLSADVLRNALVGSQEQLDFQSFNFGQCKQVSIFLPHSSITTSIQVTRSGYTGEDGFEISISPEAVQPVVEHLLRSAGPGRLRLAGLGARDSLRLEAGMCLYGHDLDDTTTPVEAGLAWIVHKNRRTAGGFHGDKVILQQLQPAKKDGGGGPLRRRVGLLIQGAPAREGAEIVITPDGKDKDQEEPKVKVIGKVTSGSPSPTLGQNIAMGYVQNGYHKAGTELEVLVRGKRREAKVVKMPFVLNRYYKEAAVVGTTPA